MMRALSLLSCCAISLQILAQTAPATYWVRFTDKSNTPYSLDTPEAFLSQRSIERRIKQGIAVDETDLPVDPAYIQALLAAGQFQLHTVSRWFNAVTIRSTDTLALDTLTQLPFVAEMRCVSGRSAAGERRTDKWADVRPRAFSPAEVTYGDSYRQIEMLNGHLLHSLGHVKGEGMLIGVLDSGFDKADSLAAFAALRARGGILNTRDMVCANCDVFQEHWHGRTVLSILAGDVPGQLLGTAPEADFVLIRTEDVHSEYPIEEDNWITGAEHADSIGCDVLNTSLGYTLFDDSTMDHSYAQLDGETIRMSIAAGMAARKGMIPVQSAGNSGGDAWHHIGVPADANDILAVGAVGPDRLVAGFSSRGPSADGRVKPDVSAMGYIPYGLDVDGTNVVRINGTSFSSPLVCGLTTCLWQAHTDKTAQDIMRAVRLSASHYETPNDSIGHGIPDFWRAHLLLGGNDLTHLQAPTFFHVYPSPFADVLNLEVFTGEASTLDLDLIDASGRMAWSRKRPVETHRYTQVSFADASLAALPNGVYTLRCSLSGRAEITQRIVKAP